MWNRLRSPLLIAPLLAAFNVAAPPLANGYQFFENTLRRSAQSDAVAPAIVRVGGCTGFHVSNRQGKTLVMTARHCLAYKATEWCRAGGVTVDSVSGEQRRCLRVAAGSTDFDPVLFEMTGSPSSLGLQLVGAVPAPGLRLWMYGYPSDPYAAPGLNISENCWVQPNGSTRNPLSTPLGAEVFFFNCSIYGGNSGGPILIEGYLAALGLPSEYTPDKFENRRSADSTRGQGFANFVRRFGGELAGLGVDIVSDLTHIRQTYVSSSLRLIPGVYSSSNYPGYQAHVRVIYNTNSTPSEVRILWKQNHSQAEVLYQCHQEVCTSASGDAVLSDFNQLSFTYSGPRAQPVRFDFLPNVPLIPNE